MISSSVAKVVISGTFRKSLSSLEEQYRELIDTNCQVLSPRSINFDAENFVRSKSETLLHIKTIQDNHLASVQEADFVWLHCPDGYIGHSGAFEIGYAHAHGIPVFSKELPRDEMLREYVTVCRSVFEAKQQVLNLR
jgi:nucleoside 2-deoxyribosyltransferase